ncbi:hypothetical protein MBLNU230_g1030t1 [Neophaeotheca triangularis]
MFAARANQENAIYSQQTAAAAKPANQNLKPLAPKTPSNNKAPKTPFKPDENTQLLFNKPTTGKPKQDNALFDSSKRNAFQTPAPRTNRAPLGQKTTNAKTLHPNNNNPTSLAAPKSQAPKAASPRHRRGLLKIHDPTASEEQEAEDEEALLPPIEHMPARETPLPDHPSPDLWPAERTYPQFEGANFSRGWWGAFSDRGAKGSEDEEEGFSDLETKIREVEGRKVKRGTPGKKAAPVLQGTARDPLAVAAKKEPSTLRSRSAASALSSASSGVPGFAAPTVATKARKPLVVGKRATSRETTRGAATGKGNPRHTAARVASNTTLGYSKGRAVSGAARKPLSGVLKEEGRGENAREDGEGGKTVGGTTLDKLLGLNLGRTGEEDDLVLGELGGDGQKKRNEEQNEDEEAFQLDEVVLE